jgi:hypothetical protein
MRQTEVLAHLAHPERGYSLGLTVSIAPVDAVTEIIFNEAVQTEVILSRRTGPVVGVRGRFCDTYLARRVLGPPTDAMGRAVWSNLAPGEYVFVFDDDGYWPIFQRVAIAEGMAPLRVELYRLCTVQVDVTRNGRPVPGVAVEMQRVGGATSLDAFIATGQVHSSTGTLRTGSDGIVELEGVAEARYSWSVELPDGARFDGEVEVEPGPPTLLSIQL